MTANKFYFYRQYSYAVFILQMSQNPKQLPNFTKKSRNRHCSNCFQGSCPPIYFSFTVSYRFLYMHCQCSIGYQKSFNSKYQD